MGVGWKWVEVGGGVEVSGVGGVGEWGGGREIRRNEERSVLIIIYNLTYVQCS